MNRRHFLRSIIGAGLATAISRRTWARIPTSAPLNATLKILADAPLNLVPPDYTGLSYETVQLSDPDFFSKDNIRLVTLFQNLSPHGVLRLGGNSSEFCWWKDSDSAVAPITKTAGQGRADNWMPQSFHPIAPKAIDNLAGFLEATQWSLIYGLNFGTGAPDRDATEAAYVARAAGKRLKYFQIGNEPDFYSHANNLLRPPGWGFNDYMNEWTTIAHAVLAKVPDARFGGPDMGASSDWVTRFAEQAPARLGDSIAMLSGHYYAEGPPDSPSADIPHLLAANPQLIKRMQQIVPIAQKAGLAYRMTEGNSCYRGGKPGVSNTLASALWGADYMLLMGSLGCKGINFHGGGDAQISAALGSKLPGVRNSADAELAKLGTFYSPIVGSHEAGFFARPIYYGMMLAQQFAGTTLLRCQFDTAGANATGYAARNRDGGYRIAMFNKSPDQDLQVEIQLQDGQISSGKSWRLSANALDATTGVTLAGAEVDENGQWSPTQIENVQKQDGGLNLALRRASGMLMFLNAG